MRTFFYQGIKYRSLSDFAKRHGVSYSRLKRLCRRYARAHQDPGIAAAWMMGAEELNARAERKTRASEREKLSERIKKMNQRHRLKVERLKFAHMVAYS